jgi:methylisocitrate lyase
MHIEDQQLAKRCGHRPNKAIVGADEMCDRLKAAVDARTDDSFVVMARTDAFAREGLEAAVARTRAYVEAGADMIFAEALTTLDEYRTFCDALDVPVLANLTEFGVTPNFTAAELADAGVAIALYPLSAFRAMSQAALGVYRTILEQGTQRTCIESMQTREALYAVLDYHAYERKLDALYANESNNKEE